MSQAVNFPSGTLIKRKKKNVLSTAVTYLYRHTHLNSVMLAEQYTVEKYDLFSPMLN